MWTDQLATSDAAVVTDLSLLRTWLMRTGQLTEPNRIHFLLHYDMANELLTLLHRENGQQAAVLAALDHNFYGRPVLESGRDPNTWDPGTIVVFDSDDSRLEKTIDLKAWRERMLILHDADGLLIGRIKPRAP